MCTKRFPYCRSCNMEARLGLKVFEKISRFFIFISTWGFFFIPWASDFIIMRSISSSGLTEVVWTGQEGNTSNSVQRADEGGELSMNSLSSGPRA